MKKRIIVTLRLFGYGLVHTMDGILNASLVTIPKDYNMKYSSINGRDGLDPAYAKSSENYPPTPPSVHCITFPDVSRTRGLHAGQWFMRLRVIYSGVRNYTEIYILKMSRPNIGW